MPASAVPLLWWERFPERRASELKELERAGIPYDIDDAAEANGVLRLHLRPTLGDRPLRLTATFPDHYPYFPFIVEAPDLDLAHHQHPFAKTLCLLPRDTRWWHPASD